VAFPVLQKMYMDNIKKCLKWENHGELNINNTSNVKSTVLFVDEQVQ
jgi:hypothetical protein